MYIGMADVSNTNSQYLILSTVNFEFSVQYLHCDEHV